MSPALRMSWVTLNSMGNPWQSHPGTYGARNPRIVLYLTMMSLSILFSAVPDVHVAIRKRRPIVQHIRRRATSSRLDLLVKVSRIPPGKHLRLPLRQVGLHREVRLRQVQRIFIICLGLSHMCPAKSGQNYHAYHPKSMKPAPLQAPNRRDALRRVRPPHKAFMCRSSHRCRPRALARRLVCQPTLRDGVYPDSVSGW